MQVWVGYLKVRKTEIEDVSIIFVLEIFDFLIHEGSYPSFIVNQRKPIRIIKYLLLK